MDLQHLHIGDEFSIALPYPPPFPQVLSMNDCVLPCPLHSPTSTQCFLFNMSPKEGTSPSVNPLNYDAGMNSVHTRLSEGRACVLPVLFVQFWAGTMEINNMQIQNMPDFSRHCRHRHSPQGWITRHVTTVLQTFLKVFTVKMEFSSFK